MEQQQSSNATSAKRGSNVDRASAMQKRIFEAAITVLANEGYAAASTHHIQKVADISRGALLHHFPTKASLMIGVAKYIVRQQTIFYHQALAKIDDPVERYFAMTEAVWEAVKRPTGIAMIEILLATRSDADLLAQFRAVEAKMERLEHREVWHLARAAGVTDRDAVRRLTNLGLASMRGLMIQRLYADDANELEESFQMYLDFKRSWIKDVCG